MFKRLQEIAEFIEGELKGNPDILISGISGIKEAKEGEITFLANPKYAVYLEKTSASAIIVPYEIDSSRKAIIRVRDPSLAFTKLISLFSPYSVKHPQGIHPTAIIGRNVNLGEAVSLGAYVVIEDEVEIGDGTVIYPGCFIGYKTKIGKNTIIYPNVSIRERVTIGERVIIHSGSVIGSDGFGFVNVDGLHHKIPQVGIVEIGDDVEIGANVTIDRARFDKTIIGKGTKIDNLVHIAHNVVIGENSIIVAQVGISGSTTIGKNVTLAGQVGLVGHITIGDNSIVMAQSGVSKSFPENSTLWGTPAKPVNIAKKINACVQNLPRLYKKVSELEKRLSELEKRNG